MLFVFTGLAFLSAFLLFLIQPVIAKALLPYLGGAPAVWNTSMVFFQFLLLVGYSYAHLLTQKIPARRQAWLHTALLLVSLLALPIAIHVTDTQDATAHPTRWLLLHLLLAVGLPFFLLSTNAPLLQRVFSQTNHPSAHNPYRLYLASNAGSLLALLCFPFVIEPLLHVGAQFTLWSVLYGAFALSTGALLFFCPRREAPIAQQSTEEPAVPFAGQLQWFALALVPSALMLGVTTFITTDIAAVPLLWVIPLGLYLLTFILAFGRYGEKLFHRMYDSEVTLLLLVTIVMAFPMLNAMLGGVFFLHLCLFFAIALRCHAQLAMLRPAPRHLTLFYLWLSLGGVAGSLLCSLLAPLLFTKPLEYPLILLLAPLLRPWRGGYTRRRFAEDIGLIIGLALALKGAGWLIGHVATAFPAVMAQVNQRIDGWFPGRDIKLNHFVVVFVLLALALYIHRVYRRPLVLSGSLVLLWLMLPLLVPAEGKGVRQFFAARNFFGIVKVMGDDSQHVLINGNTVHGVQGTGKERLQPTSYYGEFLRSLFKIASGSEPVAVLGLGAGTLACSGQKGQQVDMYEINPVVIDIAQNPEYFTYLRDCPTRKKVILGDARLSIVQAPDHYYGVIVLDVFSSDAVPTHLLTLQAVDLYRKKLAPGGLIAFHISSRHLNLAPLLKSLSEATGMAALTGRSGEGGKQASLGLASVWVVMAEKPERLKPLEGAVWKPLSGRTASLWTDDFSNIVDILY